MDVGPYHAERLSILDAVFLDLEDARHPMHMAALLVFDAGAVRKHDGVLDVERIARHVDAHMADLPRYRQRLRRVPMARHPVWVDDPAFDVRRHVRGVTLLPPGDDEQLQDLAGDLMGRRLPHDAPLWELYVVDGLRGDRFAVLAKVHHCMGDGVLGMAALASLLRTEPTPGEVPHTPHEPLPQPPVFQLLTGEVRDRYRAAGRMLRGVGSWLTNPQEGKRTLASFVRGAASHAQVLRPASVTPLNCPRLGPRRRVQWIDLDMDRVEAIKRHMQCTVNDVVLALVAGAARRHLIEDGTDPARTRFRVMVPVSRRGGSEAVAKHDGNRMSLILAPLPVHEPDALRRLQRTAAIMGERKMGGQVESMEVMEELAELGFSPLFAWITHRLLRLRPVNLVVTNLVGPRAPLYLLEARCRQAYPFIPLLGTVGVAVAVFSYAGRLGMGINADGHAADPEAFVRSLHAAFDELQAAVFPDAMRPVAGGTPPAGTPPGP